VIGRKHTILIKTNVLLKQNFSKTFSFSKNASKKSKFYSIVACFFTIVLSHNLGLQNISKVVFIFTNFVILLNLNTLFYKFIYIF